MRASCARIEAKPESTGSEMCSCASVSNLPQTDTVFYISMSLPRYSRHKITHIRAIISLVVHKCVQCTTSRIYFTSPFITFVGLYTHVPLNYLVNFFTYMVTYMSAHDIY